MHRLGARGGSRRPRGRRLIGAVALLGVTVACAVPPLPIPETGWELVFGDGFEGTELKPIWAEAPFVDSLPATVADGITVRSASANGHQWGYLATTGPRIEAEPSYPDPAAWQEGYVEARLRHSNDYGPTRRCGCSAWPSPRPGPESTAPA